MGLQGLDQIYGLDCDAYEKYGATIRYLGLSSVTLLIVPISAPPHTVMVMSGLCPGYYLEKVLGTP